MPNIGNDINNGLGNGAQSINLGSWGNWEDIGSNVVNFGYSLIHPFGWYTLPIYAGVGFAAAITLGPKWGVFYGNPPSGYAGAIIQAFFPTMVKRAKINLLDGKPLMKTVEIDGKSMEVPDTETVWTSNGTYMGSFVNLNNYHIDSEGCVTKNGFVYNPKTGDDDPEPEPEPILNDNPAGDTRINVYSIPNPFGAMNRYLANNFAHYYLGNHWFLARASSREIGWYTRRGNELVKRQEWGRYIRVTEVDTAFDVTQKEPMLDLSGFPWWAQVTIIYKIRHLDKAWVSIPNSDDIMIRLVRGALTDWWQENAVLVYEGQDLDKKPKKKPKPADELKNIPLGAEGNKDLGERFLEHLGRRPDPKPAEVPDVEPAAEQPESEKKPKMTGLCLEIMNKYGREITNIVIERKGLAGDYEKLLTGIKEAELKRRADIIRSQGRREVMKNISEGIDYQVTAIKKGEEAGRIAVLAGLFNEKGEEPSDEDKLTTAFLFKEELKQGKSESGGRKTGGRGKKEFYKPKREQDGED